jgi:hypothetical protein
MQFRCYSKIARDVGLGTRLGPQERGREEGYEIVFMIISYGSITQIKLNTETIYLYLGWMQIVPNKGVFVVQYW